MSDDDGIDVGSILGGDSVITSCALRQLSDDLIEQDEEQKLLNGELDMVCTYPESYKPRQSLYSCLTCKEETGQVAGICYACAENCHNEHDVIQLYTKRNFCCDCGNSKFKKTCSLFESKIALNRKNKYNHNFSNAYCTCERPYPPPENDALRDAELLQCIVCEDWYHAVHLELEKSSFDEHAVEIVCRACTTRLPWLMPYAAAVEAEIARRAAETKKTTTETDATTATSSFDAPSSSTSAATTENAQLEVDSTPPIDNRATESSNDCYLQKIKPAKDQKPCSIYFVDSLWRYALCRCAACKRVYEDEDCEYLLDQEDSVQSYVDRNAAALDRRAPSDQLYEEVAKRTSDDVARNVITEFAHLKRRFAEHFEGHATEQKVITASEVVQFFDKLKRQRREEKPEDGDV